MRALLFITALIASPATAEVVHADAHGFEVNETVPLVVPAPQAMAAFTDVASWWSKDHTYSGDAANLSLDARPGGCFCERFPKGGGIEHLRVTRFQPDEHIVLIGTLGPLLGEAVTGVMDVSVIKIAGGSRLTLNYKTAGFESGNADKFAPAVDAMLADQVKRYRQFVSRGGGR